MDILTYLLIHAIAMCFNIGFAIEKLGRYRDYGAPFTVKETALHYTIIIVFAPFAAALTIGTYVHNNHGG